MPQFTLSRKALEDLKEIGRYTERQWGREQRTTYLTMLDSCFHALAAEPLKGKDRKEVLPGYRSIVAGKHVIFYLLTATDSVEIVRILHGRMDIDTHLL